MRRWFLSYNSQDLALMRAYEAALRRVDAGAHVFAAHSSLRAGGYWMPELAREIAEATAFILLVGAKGLGPWQKLEYFEALDKRVQAPDFPVVLVLRDGQSAPGLPFLRQFHWIVSQDPPSAENLAQLMDAAPRQATQPRELWRHVAPYRGLAAMTEADSDYFFGRGRETQEILNTLAATPDRLPILFGNSGVGKSSLAQAGVLASLLRQNWPRGAATDIAWPRVFHDSRSWCFLNVRPGTDPLRALVESFIRTWQLDATDPLSAKRRSGWVKDLIDGVLTLRDLLDATAQRYRDELRQSEPPAFLLYVDQGEELYRRSDERQRRRFSEVLAEGLGDRRLWALMSMRSDFLGALQNDEPLFGVHRKIDVPPLRDAELREVVSRPASLLDARFEADWVADDIAHRAAVESARDAGALPLLSFLLDDMWTQMVARSDGVLRLPAHGADLGGVLRERADGFLAQHPASQAALRRLLTVKLATVREDGEPTPRRALRSEFNDEEWRLVSELADHPHRLLVTATPESGETYAEVAHEAIFRRWSKLSEWIAQERDFLVWRNEVEAARRRWQATPEASRRDALLMGLALAQAQEWLSRRADDVPGAERTFIEASVERDALDRRQRRRLRRQTRQMAILAAVLITGILTGLAWSNRDYLLERGMLLAETVWPRTLTADAERALKAGASFKECADCPEMVVVPAGKFTMGSPETEEGRYEDEGPPHEVTIAAPLAVARFDTTFDEWDACVTLGGCTYQPFDQGFGRGRQPVINVNWHDARQYVAWISQRTGKPYRLLSEAEYEYAARAGTTTAYWWGDDAGDKNANCNGCGSPWDAARAAPVGSFRANPFGLYDMNGNIWKWAEDCYQDSYDGAPTDGSARIVASCSTRAVRGGSWLTLPQVVRSASRFAVGPGFRDSSHGFRVARTLAR